MRDRTRFAGFCVLAGVLAGVLCAGCTDCDQTACNEAQSARTHASRRRFIGRAPMSKLLWLCLVAGCAHASAPPPAAPAHEQDATLAPERVVQAEVTAPASVARGEHAALQVALRIAEGYHVMSDQPSNPLYIATHVHWNGVDGVTFEQTTYPAPHSFDLGSEQIATFEGELTVTAPFTVAGDTAPGTRELTGTLEYQSCTFASCLFPVKRPLHAQLVIAP
jgi:DsbC/DsbD-like thiol-disulfide interchange protein